MKNKLNTSLSLRKLLLSALVAAPLATLPSPLWALPVGDASNLTSSVGLSTAGGQTQVTSVGSSMTITTPDRTVLTWGTFGSAGGTINSGETINYNLPGATSAVLNRVTGGTATTIGGTLISNGKIFVLNPSGVILSSTGNITASGVALSSVSESDFNFASTGSLSFSGPAGNSVISAGTITVGSSGTVALAGKDVYVAGAIDAGSVSVISLGNTTLGGNSTVVGSGNGLTVGNQSAKYGNMTVTTNGGIADLAGNSSNVVISGGSLSVNTTSTSNVAGAVIQGGAGALVIGDTSGAGNLSITANGSTTNGAVTLPKVQAANGKQLNLTLNAGTTSVTNPSGNLQLNASTITSSATPAIALTTTSGDIVASGNTTIVGNGTISLTSTAGGKKVGYNGVGDLVFSTISAPTGNVTLKSTTGNVTLPAATVSTLSVTAANNIIQTASTALTVSGDATFDAGNVITLTETGNDFTNLILKNAPGGASIVDKNDILLAKGTNATGNVTISAPGGAITLGSASGDSISVAGDLTLTSGNGVTITLVSAGSGYTTPATVSFTGGGGTGAAATTTLGLNAIATPTTAGTGYTTPPAVTLTGGGGTGATATTTLGINAITVPTTAGTGYTVGDPLTLTGGGGSGATAVVASVDGAGAITGINVTAPGTGYTSMPTVTFGGTGTGATGSSATGQVASVVVGAAGTGYTSMPTITFAAPTAGTTATGSTATGKVATVTLTSAGTGYTSAPAPTLSGNATASTALSGGLTEGTDNLTVLGKLNITSGGAVTLDGKTHNSVNMNNQFGQVNINAAGQAVKIFEKTTLNLGNVTAGSLNAYSATSVINSGQLVITGNVTVGAGTSSAPGDITLDFAGASAGQGNQITGTIFVNNDLALLNQTDIGNYLAKSLTIANENATKLVVPVNIYGAGLTGDISITELTSNGISNVSTGAADAIITTGKLSLTTKTGAINLSNTNNKFSTVTVTSGGDITALKAGGDYTLNATLSEATAGHSASYNSTGNIVLGTYTSNYTGATTFTVANGKKITDSQPGVTIFGAVSFTAPGGLTVNKSGHNFGGVTINTSGNNSAATLIESGTLRLVTVSTGKGALSLTSTNGDIIQTGTITVGDATATFNATKGAVVLDNAANAFGNAVGLSAVGNSTLKATGSVALGNITVSAGTLAVTLDNASNITQSGNSTIYAYGDTSFVTGTTGNITVANSNNRFGGLTLTTGSGNVSVKELTTMNLKSVTTSGSLSATSEGGNIIDSGTGAISATAGSTFVTPKGNVTLALAGSNYTTVGFTASGNVSLLDGAANLDLAASTVGGTFTVTNSTGNISQSGALLITGDTTFNATGATSGINLSNSANQFGGLQFFVGTTGATIYETTSMNLRGGTVATGPVILSTGGNFVTSGSGQSSFLLNTGAVGTGLQISATGTIIPGTGSLIVLNGLTATSSSAVDLSGLSLQGNLYGKAPIHPGTGTYTPPSQ